MQLPIQASSLCVCSSSHLPDIVHPQIQPACFFFSTFFFLVALSPHKDAAHKTARENGRRWAVKTRQREKIIITFHPNPGELPNVRLMTGPNTSVTALGAQGRGRRNACMQRKSVCEIRKEGEITLADRNMTQCDLPMTQPPFFRPPAHAVFGRILCVQSSQSETPTTVMWTRLGCDLSGAPK